MCDHIKGIFGEHTIWSIRMADGMLTKIVISSTVRIYNSINTKFGQLASAEISDFVSLSLVLFPIILLPKTPASLSLFHQISLFC